MIPKAILDRLAPDTISDAFVLLLDFSLSTGTHLRYARYASDVTYDTNTYTAWPFAAQWQEGGKGHSVPTTTLTIEDAVQTLRPYAYATQWFRDCELTTVLVCVEELTASYTWATLTYDIKQARPVGEAIQLTLGGPNPVKMRFPADRYWADQCPYARGFKNDPRCGYTGSETSCDGSLARCTELGNQTRFGGFLGLDPDAAKLVIPMQMRR